VLARARHTISQTTLGAGQRKHNVAEAFRTIGSEVRDRIVLLCDDVCTTGATLNACAERLLQAGARRVVAATVARDIPRQEQPDIMRLIPGGLV
jgi:predicted amidophosphoribosyltransferase